MTVRSAVCRWLLVAGGAVCVRAAEQQIVLREYLNRAWTNEWVSYPFSAPPGECHPESVALAGPEGAVPVQLSEIARWPDSPFVRTGRLSFVASPAPLQEATYTVRYGPLPVAHAPLHADLEIAESDGAVEIQTRLTGVRVLTGRHAFADPVAAASVPGPILGVRLADGTWCGASRMYGPAPIAGYEGELIAGGAVHGEARVWYHYADGRTLEVAARLSAGDARVCFRMAVAPYDREAAVRLVFQPGFGEGERLTEPLIPEDGWQFLLSVGVEGLMLHQVPWEFYQNTWGAERGAAADVELARQPAGELTRLVPWGDWWDDRTQTSWTLKTAARAPFLRVRSEDAGAWVEPAAPGTWAAWGNPRMRQKWVPLVRGEDETIAMQFNLARGERKWVIEALSPGGAKSELSLNEMKGRILEWAADPAVRFPHLYLDPEELAEVRARGPADPGLVARLQSRWSSFLGYPHGSDADALGVYLLDGTREMAERTRVVDRLRHHLGLMGGFDRMRNVGILVSLYDALMGTDLIAPEEKREFRAKMAYLGYLMADPGTWSMERGFCSGNQNMSVSYTLNLGMIACLLCDHPMARAWVEPGLAMMERWMQDSVGPAGEWPESVCNYAHVSASAMLPFAIAARHAGFQYESEYPDYVSDPRMKRLLRYLAQQYTPPDPRHGGNRVAGLSGTAPLGRAGAGARFGLAGLMARATRDSDPHYSRHQQWSWLLTGKSRNIANCQMGGYEYVYLDDSLPAEPADWGSECFPEVGLILRHGLGTENEYYVNFMINYSFGYPSESGAFPCIFAKGVPVCSRFAGGYAEREELLLGRVLPARGSGTIEERYARFFHEGRRRISGFCALPRQDYAVADLTIEETRSMRPFDGHNAMTEVPEWPPVPQPGQPPIQWRRQVLFLKDDDPASANYLVLRDTVTGGQPTIWQFWTISEKIGTPAQVQDRAAFLADRPGDQVLGPRPLEGDRFTAVGQFGVDVEYYIAAPAHTPRHTLRWGKKYEYSPIHLFSEYQDLLHLQLPGDGVYFVVLFPRRPAEPVPDFSAVGDGLGVRIHGEFGTDYAFLSGTETECAADGVAFRGTAAAVQDRRDGLVLSLGSTGTVRCREYALRCDQGVSLRVEPECLRVQLPRDHAGALVEVHAPGDWTIDTSKGAEVSRQAQRYLLKIQPATPELTLIPQ